MSVFLASKTEYRVWLCRFCSPDRRNIYTQYSLLPPNQLYVFLGCQKKYRECPCLFFCFLSILSPWNEFEKLHMFAILPAVAWHCIYKPRRRSSVPFSSFCHDLNHSVKIINATKDVFSVFLQESKRSSNAPCFFRSI
jgi:hypothetical protein